MTDTRKKMGRPATGKALSGAERMRALRARKAAAVAERAAGIVKSDIIDLSEVRTPKAPPAPRKAVARDELQAIVADAAHWKAKAGEFEAQHRMLEATVRDLRLTNASLAAQLASRHAEPEPRAASVLKGREPSAKHRLAALTLWAASDRWHGPARVKTLRSNLSRAMSTLDQLKAMLAGQGTAPLGYDVELLSRTLAVLAAYHGFMGQADAVAAQTLRRAEEDLAQRQQTGRERALTQVFGRLTPDPLEVRALAADLLAYEGVAGEWLAARHSVAAGRSSIPDPDQLERLLDRPAGLFIVVADTVLEMPANGSLFNSDAGPKWIGGWKDFEDWRTSCQLSSRGDFS